MEITNVKIKDSITIVDHIDAVEFIVNSYFTNGRYTPYYVDMAKNVAIATFFLEGVKFEEDDDIYRITCTDEKIKPLVDKFLVASVSKTSAKYIAIMEKVMKDVEDIVDFNKQVIIHSHSSIDEKLEKLIEKEIRNKDYELKVLNDAEKLQKEQIKQTEYANKVAELMTPEEAAQMNKMFADGKFDASEMAKIVTEKYLQSDMHDKNTQQIIEEKNNKIKDLEMYKKMHDARNVLTDKKE